MANAITLTQPIPGVRRFPWLCRAGLELGLDTELHPGKATLVGEPGSKEDDLIGGNWIVLILQ
jgi:hypothetical protein